MHEAPKVCAVCGIVMERRGKRESSPDDEWLHVQELVGISDHVAIPVDYGAVPINVHCDFCYTQIPDGHVWTVPADDFDMPNLVDSNSVGHWAACDECATLITRRRWGQLISRVMDLSPAGKKLPRSVFKGYLNDLYGRLQVHLQGSPRPWRAGDEKY